MAGRRSRDAGARYELELKKHFEAQGFKAERVYASGAIGTRMGRSAAQNLNGDVIVTIPYGVLNMNLVPGSELLTEDVRLEVEVKYRGKAFPKFLTHMDKPFRAEGLCFFPGANLLAALTTPIPMIQRIDRPTSRYVELLDKSDLLACRFPKKPGMPDNDGWGLVIPESLMWKLQKGI